jgi:hypothetical protein
VGGIQDSEGRIAAAELFKVTLREGEVRGMLPTTPNNLKIEIYGTIILPVFCLGVKPCLSD